jgi:phosphoglycolate phosphatase
VNPKWNFKIVLGAGGDVPRKPNPGGARIICEELRLDPSEVLYVGDSSVDMETAIAANMHPVGVTWGFRSRQELEKSGAQTIIDAPMQLLKLL